MDDEIKFPERTKGPEGAEQAEREKWLIKGREIYETWRKAMVNTPAKKEDMVARFYVLRDLLVKNIKHQDVLDVMLKQVDVSIENAAKKYPAPEIPKSQSRAAKRATWTAKAAAKNAARTSPRGGAGGTRPESGGATGFDPANN